MMISLFDDVHLTRYTIIIDGLILRSTITSLLLLLLKCYFRIYFKYRTTLNLFKYNFLRTQFECVGHYIPSNGKTTTSCKCDLITDWYLPPNGDSLHSYISLCNFYDKVLPLFKIKVTPLRMLYAFFVKEHSLTHVLLDVI